MSTKSVIEIKGARVHNLKNLSVSIPHGKMTVITGLSGSGKSSLAFDTLFAEGQRRYIESLSSYARQFLGKLDKPEVDYIKGISPAIAIQQKVISNNPRSTVGTSTEIYDYLKVLYARIGTTFSPISGNEVLKHTVTDVVQFVYSFSEGARFLILSKIKPKKNTTSAAHLGLLLQQGFSRVFHQKEMQSIEELIGSTIDYNDLYLIIDRVSVDAGTDENKARIADSAQIAFNEGEGEMFVFDYAAQSFHPFSNRFELDGIEFQEPTEHFFAFNNPFGACKKCEGFGMIIGIDPKLVIPNEQLSVFEGAIQPWKGETMGEYLKAFIYAAQKEQFPIHRPISELNEEQRKLLWEGSKHIQGIHDFFKFVESQTYKIQYRVMLSRYRGRTVCPDCHGTRLRKDTHYVKINGKSLMEVIQMPIAEAFDFFSSLHLPTHHEQIAKRILPEITNRLGFLMNVGLHYLTLNRPSNSLSGGESQRINLATSLGSSLVGSMYILDEPSIGLHPRDTEKLIGVLKNLRDLGNTIIVVEHEEDIMRAADHLIDIGPQAGVYGGELVFSGNHAQLINQKTSLTAQYLNGTLQIPIPKKRRPFKNKLTIEGARLYNLKNITVTLPLQQLVCITGVSGSGKSTLIKDIVYPAIRKELGLFGDFSGQFQSLSGDLKWVKEIEWIDQNPIGKSSRSNPITYVKAFDDVRELFAKQPLAKMRAYKPGFFSFNVEGGRCEMCEGEGEITVGMQFMADVHLPCETCEGKRYKSETLEVELEGKNIADILEMDLQDTFEFFSGITDKLAQKITEKLKPLLDVGLGYLKTGQSSSTLSGGEAQRIKLASFLSKGLNVQPTLFIFDEPTTGLHFHDIAKLLIAMNALVDRGHSIIIIEHNMDVIKCADWIIDLGPDGGEQGGQILFAGTPEQMLELNENHTAKFLREKWTV